MACTRPDHDIPCQTREMPAEILNVTRGDATPCCRRRKRLDPSSPPLSRNWDQAHLCATAPGILAWTARHREFRGQVSRRTLDPAPAEPAELPDWYRHHLDATLDLFCHDRSGHADVDVLEPRGPPGRMVGPAPGLELAIHRWDAEYAAIRSVPPLDGDIAAAGVGEFLTEFLPGLLTRADPAEPAGTLHLHATDGPLEWFIDLDNARALSRTPQG